jgi:hypothetical protein
MRRGAQTDSFLTATRREEVHYGCGSNQPACELGSPYARGGEKRREILDRACLSSAEERLLLTPAGDAGRRAWPTSRRLSCSGGRGAGAWGVARRTPQGGESPALSPPRRTPLTRARPRRGRVAYAACSIWVPRLLEVLQGGHPLLVLVNHRWRRRSLIGHRPSPGGPQPPEAPSPDRRC